MIVTSFSQTGYHEYGKTFIQTCLANCKDEHLTVFYEKTLPSNAPKHRRLTYVNLYEFEDFKAFEERVASSPAVFRGLLHKDGKQLYNFRFDVNRFYRKVFAITEADKRCSDNVLTWLDADVVFHNPVPEGFFKSLPESSYLALLGRAGLYSECGYIGFNRAYPGHEEFMRHYRGIYFTNAFARAAEWHDSYLFDMVRELLQCPCRNLSKGIMSKNPFVDSVLGQYMDHKKGPDRKGLKMSPEFERRHQSNEVAGMSQ